MTRTRAQHLTTAGWLAAIGGTLGIVAGLTQATVGSRIPEWSGNKDQPVALGLLTIALGASVVVAVRTLWAVARPRDETLVAITLWLAAVAVLCSTTVGGLWLLPGLFLLAAALVTKRACGWGSFRSVVATNWLRGLLGILGVFEALMAVSAAPALTIAAGLFAGGALIGASLLAGPGRRLIVSGLVAATLPFAIVTWWAIIPPLLTATAFAIGIAATRTPATRDSTPDIAPQNLHPVG